MFVACGRQSPRTSLHSGSAVKPSRRPEAWARLHPVCNGSPVSSAPGPGKGVAHAAASGRARVCAFTDDSPWRNLPVSAPRRAHVGDFAPAPLRTLQKGRKRLIGGDTGDAKKEKASGSRPKSLFRESSVGGRRICKVQQPRPRAHAERLRLCKRKSGQFPLPSAPAFLKIPARSIRHSLYVLQRRPTWGKNWYPALLGRSATPGTSPFGLVE